VRFELALQAFGQTFSAAHRVDAGIEMLKGVPWPQRVRVSRSRHIVKAFVLIHAPPALVLERPASFIEVFALPAVVLVSKFC
jgi:hypothetical protein